jgi:hypothetical protein
MKDELFKNGGFGSIDMKLKSAGVECGPHTLATETEQPINELITPREDYDTGEKWHYNEVV